MAHADTSAMVITTAPTQRQVRDLLWREIRSLYYRNAALIGGTIGRTTLELGPHHFATGLSTDSPERFQGFHETNILFVVDEASGVREEIYEAIEGSMTSRRVRLLLIGNPTSLTGTFYKAFHQQRAQYKTIHISAFDTPNLIRVRDPNSEITRAADTDPEQAISSGRRRPPWSRVAIYPPSVPPEGGMVGNSSGRPDSESGLGRRTARAPRGSVSSGRPDSESGLGRRTARSPRGTPEPRGRPGETGLARKRKKLWHANALPGIVTPEWVDDAAKTWGTDSAQYQVRVLGEFPTQSNDTLIPLAQIEAAISDEPSPAPARRARNILKPAGCRAELDPVSVQRADNVSADPTGCPHNPKCHPEALEGRQERDRTEPVEIGVDVARFGTDRTVICIRQGHHVIALDQYQKLDTMRTTGLVVNAINRYNPQSVRIDEIGIGAGVVDRLHELNHAIVEGINVGNRASDPEHFFNLRSELYDGIRARFEEGTIKIPNDEELIGQLSSIRVEYTSRGQLKVEPKETMRRRSLPSPDKADALLLAFAPTSSHSAFRIWTGTPVSYSASFTSE